MDPAEDYDHHLRRLKVWRNRPQPDLTLGFLRKTFKREIEKPYRQLERLTPLWRTLVPEHLLNHTALVALQRGVLTIQADDSATLYELDRLLRSGLEQQLRTACGTTLRRVKLRVGTV